MKKIFTAILLFCTTLVSIIHACSPVFFGYFTENDKIYYGIPGSTDTTYRVELVGVDTTNFEYKKFNSYYYASDKEYVYYCGKIIEGLDPVTAQFLGGIRTLICDDGYVKDDKNVFFCGKKIENANADSFESFPARYSFNGYGKDNQHVFVHDSIIDRDVNTFRLLDEAYSIDKNGIYFYDYKLPGADPNDYRQNRYFLMSNGKIFLNGAEVTKYDYDTFEILNIYSSGTSCGDFYYSTSLVKDRTGMYLYDKKVPNIDPNTFEFIPKTGIMKDKNGYYFMDNSWNMKEKNSNYRFTKLPLNIATTQIDTIQLYTTRTFFWDKQNMFLVSGHDIENVKQELGIDVVTFKPYARIDGRMIFRDRFRFYEMDWINFSRIHYFSPVNARLVNMDHENICIKNNSKILTIGANSTMAIDKADPLTFDYAVGASIDINGKEYDAVHFDKKNIYYYMSPNDIRPITAEEYKHLKENIIKREDVEKQRIESLGREYKF